MIRFVVTPGHGYTFKAIAAKFPRPAVFDHELWTYPRLFSASQIRPGTWVFCDLERLGVWELGLAGDIARQIRLAGPGFRLVNDPARAACRYELLFRLHASGFNRFRAWRAEDGVPAARYPVFLRLEDNHNKPLTDLLVDEPALHAALAAQESLGVSRRGLLIVEYQAEPLAPGVFRKYAAYRIGDRIVADHTVHDVTWVAKYGDEAAWSPERYAEELDYVRGNPHAAALMHAFDIAGIDYGRADYGIVDGTPQIWEINTNPALPGRDLKKVSPLRAETTLLSWDNRIAGFRAIDLREQGPALRLASSALDTHRRWQRRFQQHLTRN
jgi:hypothetical protein